MTSNLIDEKFYRAVYPENKRPLFWTFDGKLAKEAFYDHNGLSVEKLSSRSHVCVIEYMRKNFEGPIISIISRTCNQVKIFIHEAPTKRSEHHCELWRDEHTKLLSDTQQMFLAKKSVIEHKCNSETKIR